MLARERELLGVLARQLQLALLLVQTGGLLLEFAPLVLDALPLAVDRDRVRARCRRRRDRLALGLMAAAEGGQRAAEQRKHAIEAVQGSLLRLDPREEFGEHAVGWRRVGRAARALRLRRGDAVDRLDQLAESARRTGDADARRHPALAQLAHDAQPLGRAAPTAARSRRWPPARSAGSRRAALRHRARARRSARNRRCAIACSTRPNSAVCPVTSSSRSLIDDAASAQPPRAPASRIRRALRPSLPIALRSSPSSSRRLRACSTRSLKVSAISPLLTRQPRRQTRIEIATPERAQRCEEQPAVQSWFDHLRDQSHGRASISRSLRIGAPSIACSNACVLAGLRRCRSKPTASAALRSDSWPKPVIATSHTDRPRLTAHVLRDLVAAQQRQAHVDERDIGLHALDQLEAGLAVGRGIDLVTLALEQLGHRLADVVVVVDDHDAQAAL